jgi:serine/threonine protein kinase
VGEIIETMTTPSYRSPEMVDLYSNQQIDHQSDIWVNKHKSHGNDATNLLILICFCLGSWCYILFNVI